MRVPACLLLAALLLAAFLLAGCAAPEAQTTPESVVEPDPFEAPAWQAGMAWSYRTGDGQELTLVVTGEEAGEWVLDTDAEDLALFHARDEVSYLGRVRQSDLAGSQGTDRVQYFQWPLRDGATWTTMWDGASYTVVAHQTGDTFHLQARDGGELRVEYIYDPGVKWFSSMVFYGDDGEAYSLQLQGHTMSWSGQVVRYSLGETREFSLPGSGVQQGQFPAAGDEVLLTARAVCSGAGQIMGAVTSGSLLPPLADPEPAWSLALDCSGTEEKDEEDRLEPLDWDIQTTVVGEGSLRLTLQAAERHTFAV